MKDILNDLSLCPIKGISNPFANLNTRRNSQEPGGLRWTRWNAEERKVATYVAKLNLTCWAANTGHLELLSLLMNLSPLIGLYGVNPWPCDMFLPHSTTVFIGSTGEYPQIYLNNNLTCCKSFVLVPWITFHSSIVKRWCFLTWNGKGEDCISLFVENREIF